MLLTRCSHSETWSSYICCPSTLIVLSCGVESPHPVPPQEDQKDDIQKDEIQNEPPKDDVERRQNIPVIYIDTRGAAIRDKENYVDGTITVCDPERLYSDVEEFSAPMGIRGRGNTTWSFPKKPWKVKLKEKASVLGLPPDKEWCLLANYSDRTLLRNLTAMHLSEICGFPWTPRMYSVEVYLNNEYQGVYTLCEHKKVSKDRVDIDVVGENDNNGDAVTGGYYLEIEEQQDETTCWLTSMEVPMMFSDPEEPTAQQYEYVTGLFESFEQALWAKDWSEATGYLKYIKYSFPVLSLSTGIIIMLRGVRSVKVGLYSTMVTCGFNVFLNWVFIFGHLGAPAMGASGAALATTLSYFIQLIVVLCYLFVWLSKR